MITILHSWLKQEQIASITTTCAFILALFGLFLLLHAIALSNRRTFLQRSTRAVIYMAIVGLTSIISNLAQVIIGTSAGTSMGALIGVAIAGVVASYADNLTNFVNSLTQMHLVPLGVSLFVLGAIIGSLQMLVLH